MICCCEDISGSVKGVWSAVGKCTGMCGSNDARESFGEDDSTVSGGDGVREYCDRDRFTRGDDRSVL